MNILLRKHKTKRWIEIYKASLVWPRPKKRGRQLLEKSCRIASFWEEKKKGKSTKRWKYVKKDMKNMELKDEDLKDRITWWQFVPEGKWQLKKKVSESERNYLDNKLCYTPVQNLVQRQCWSDSSGRFTCEAKETILDGCAIPISAYYGQVKGVMNSFRRRTRVPLVLGSKASTMELGQHKTITITPNSTSIPKKCLSL